MMPSSAQTCHWSQSEKAARRDEAQSEDLPVEKISNLRPIREICSLKRGSRVGFPRPCRCDIVFIAGKIDMVDIFPRFCFTASSCLRRLVPGRSANVVPDSPRGVPSPMVETAATCPLDAAPASALPGTGVFQ